MKRPSLLSSLLFSLIVTFSGCGCWSPLDEGRRAQEIETYSPCVLDYDFGFYEDEDCESDCYQWEEPSSLEPIDDTVQPYRFSHGDVLEISLLGEDESSIANATVAPDGKLYYTFLDGIEVLGRTIDEVAAEMETKLLKLFNNPVITINPQVANAQSFKVLGRVFRPGVYPLYSPLTLREAVAVAGGFQRESYRDIRGDLEPLVDLNESYIIRNGKRLNVDFKKVFFSPEEAEDIFVHADDYIYIAPAETKDVYVVGAVPFPRRVIWRRDLTLMGALAYSGGWLRDSPYGADVHSVLIVRGPLERPYAMRVDISMILQGMAKDIQLYNGDIIYVHNKTLRFGRYLVALAINNFVQSFATGAGSYYAGVKFFSSFDDGEVDTTFDGI